MIKLFNNKGELVMKRIVSFFLVIAMLVSSIILTSSCGKKNDASEEENNKSEVKTYDEESIFYERSLVEDGLETRDFGGRTLRIVADSPSEIHIDDEKRNQGDLILDAKFSRNQAVENRFNVNIEMIYTGSLSEVSDYVSKSVLSGSDGFDLLMGQVMATGGLGGMSQIQTN